MFNGIVYNQGLIKSLRKSPRYVKGSLVIEVSSNINFKKQDIGESVCCDGVCLTLIRIKKKSFLFYLSKETLSRSNFKNIKVGKFINIEKALYYGKGSISINGVSLTVSKLNLSSFEVTIIPHTLRLTNLVKLKTKDIVNIEFDMVGKYLNRIHQK